jgi:hypothetical protein
MSVIGGFLDESIDILVGQVEVCLYPAPHLASTFEKVRGVNIVHIGGGQGCPTKPAQVGQDLPAFR